MYFDEVGFRALVFKALIIKKNNYFQYINTNRYVFMGIK
jgi:hypothetical protein